MQKKYAGDGLAAVSVSLDDADEKETKAKVLKFLTKQNAVFTNLLLTDAPEVWRKRLDIAGPPAVFIYDRDGKLVKKFDDEVKHEEVEKIVSGLLKKK